MREKMVKIECWLRQNDADAPDSGVITDHVVHKQVNIIPKPGNNIVNHGTVSLRGVQSHPVLNQRWRFAGMLSPAILAMSFCASLSASEVVMTDLNLGIESLPTAFAFTIQDGSSTRTGSGEFDLGVGLSGRAVYAFSSPGSSGAFFVGGALALGGYRFEDGGTYQVAMARVVAGYAYSIDDEWTVEISPWAGLGYGRMHIPGNAVSDDHDVSGKVFDFGANLGVTYALSHSWLIGAQIGWQIVDANMAGDGLKLTLTQSGPTGFLGVVYRFGGTPPSIR